MGGISRFCLVLCSGGLHYDWESRKQFVSIHGLQGIFESADILAGWLHFYLVVGIVDHQQKPGFKMESSLLSLEDIQHRIQTRRGSSALELEEATTGLQKCTGYNDVLGNKVFEKNLQTVKDDWKRSEAELDQLGQKLDVLDPRLREIHVFLAQKTSELALQSIQDLLCDIRVKGLEGCNHTRVVRKQVVPVARDLYKRLKVETNVTIAMELIPRKINV